MSAQNHQAEAPLAGPARSSHRRVSLIGVVVLCVLAATGGDAPAWSDEPPQLRYPRESWEAAQSAERLGFASAALEEARRFAETLPTTAVMIVVDGVVLAQWGQPERIYPCHSVRKSLLSALIGIQVEQGGIRLSSTMKELSIDDNEPSLTPKEKQATVAQLLTARSGVYHGANYETRGRAAQRPARGSHPPGTFWYYNNWDFNALGTIYEQAVGVSVFEAFEREIADPLGMEDFQLNHTRYSISKASIHAAYTFNMSARDMARFGLLFLRGGRWHDRQIVPKDWVEESTAAHTEAEHTLSFGYMWWVADHGRLYPGFSAGGPAYAARGKGGHAIVVIPHLDMVVVHRVNSTVPIPSRYVGSRDLGKLLQLVVDAKLPPGDQSD